MLHLVRQLGEGGMGKVWLARHEGLETDVVVKFLAAEGADREEAEARFAREASAAAAVKSPHVVQVFDHGVTQAGTRYIVMELLEGRDLATHLAAKGPMPPSDVAAVIAQVAKALSKAHKAGVVHRDIKPENIFLCDADGGEMFVKVLDFGIAKREQQMSSKTTTGQVVGTPYYMSPEQILGEGPVDARTDIWALGVVAFEALTGKRPFEGSTVGAITLAIHRSKPRPSEHVPSLPAAFDDWFARACAREPAERFQTAREAGQAILAAVNEPWSPSGTFRAPILSSSEASDPALNDLARPQSVTSLSSSFTAEPPPARKPPMLLLAGAVVAILLLVGLVLIGTRSTTSDAKAATIPSAQPSVATTAVPASEPSVAPAVSASSAPPVIAEAPSASAASSAAPSKVVRSTTGPRPAPRPTKPARKPNDDDIK